MVLDELFTGSCPTCGQKFLKEIIRRLVDQLACEHDAANEDYGITHDYNKQEDRAKCDTCKLIYKAEQEVK